MLQDTEALKNAIRKLKQEKNAVILAHYYTIGDVQDVADFVGDSLALSRQAQGCSADIIVFAGVHFMAETAKVLSPNKKVLLPDMAAGCSLADSCKASDFALFLRDYPNHTVVSYVNTTVEVKALTDIVCTSSNAVEIVASLPKEQPIVFGPDRNLGNYVKSVTGREDMVVWDGACHVHEQFSLERIVQMKAQYPQAKLLTHPECKKPIHIISDYIGSTAALLAYAQKDEATTYIVATEPGILYQMRRTCPSKVFIPAPPSDSTCACNDCSYMKLVSLANIRQVLEDENNEILLDEAVRKKAERSILAMLSFGK